MKSNLFLFLTFLLLHVKVLHASHIAGGNITYKCLGSDKYRIRLSFYRDCTGQTFTAQTATISLRSGITSKSAVLKRTSVRALNVACSGVGTVCTGGSFPYGIEEYVFDSVVHMTPLFSPQQCLISIGFSISARTNGITNGISGAFYVESQLNRCLSICNNSVELTNVPTAVLCTNQAVSLNVGAIDTLDYDSLSYEMITPMNGYNSNASFSSGYSISKPFKYVGYPGVSLSVDPLQGDLQFTPNQVQKPVFAIRVHEWRKINDNWTEVGYVTRDMQLYVTSCQANQVPILYMNPPDPIQQVCVGETACFTITASDADGSDTTVIDWNHGIQNATFTSKNLPVKKVKHDVATFCWTPDSNDAKPTPYYITLNVTDNHCPIPSRSSYGLGVIVSPKYKLSTSKDYADCKAVFTAHTDPTSYVGEYKWRISQPDQPFIDSLSQFISNKASDSISRSPGTYIIRIQTGTNASCIYYAYDTLIFVSPFTATISGIKKLCMGDSFTCEAILTPAGSDLRYSWKYEPDTLWQSPDSSFRAVATKNGMIRLKAKNTFQCEASDSFNVYVKLKNPADSLKNALICYGDSTSLQITNTNNFYDSLQISWTGTEPFTDYGKHIKVNRSGNYLCLIKNADGCYDTAYFNAQLQPEIKTGLAADTTVCPGKTVSIQLSHDLSYQWKNLSAPASFPDNDTSADIRLNPSAAVVLLLKTEQKNPGISCYQSDTFAIGVRPLPIVKIIMPDSLLCCGDDGAFTLFPDSSGQLYLDLQEVQAKSKVRVSNCAMAGAHQLAYHYTSPITGCSDSAVKTLVTELQAELLMISSDSVCEDRMFAIGLQKKHALKPLSLSGGDGLFDPVINDHTAYRFGAMDKSNGKVMIEVVLAAENVCKEVKVQKEVFMIHKPQIHYQITPLSGCMPLDVNYSGSSDLATISWQFGDSLFEYKTPGTIHLLRSCVLPVRIMAHSYSGCDTSFDLPLMLQAFPVPESKFSVHPGKTTVARPLIDFTNQSVSNSGNDSLFYEWKFDAPIMYSPKLKEGQFEYPDEAGMYRPILKVTNVFGCSDTSSQTFIIVPEVTAYFPNSFCPGSVIERNRTFRGTVDYFESFHMEIYNRWGQKIFESDDPDKGWDGTHKQYEAPEGAYAFVAWLTGLDGNVYGYNGTLQLFR